MPAGPRRFDQSTGDETTGHHHPDRKTDPVRDRQRLPFVLLGVALGAFVDGIVLHQILQWHHMVSSHPEHPPSTIAGLRTNALADGLFHAAAWVAVAVAAVMILRQWRRRSTPPRAGAQVGLLLMGWGGFNIVEGMVNHHLLGVHHVRDDLGAPLSWDVGFLLVSAAILAAGSALTARRARHAAAARLHQRDPQDHGSEATKSVTGLCNRQDPD